MSQGVPAREPAAPVLAPADALLVDRAFDDGVAAHGVVALDRTAFRRGVVVRAVRRAEDAPLGDFLRRAALADLVLTLSCEAGDERAWETLSRTYRPRLEGVAVRRGVGGAEAQSLVQDLLGDLARPPPSGGARTVLGTFDGSGSLFAWLAVGLVRRVAARARARRVESLEAIGDAARDGAAPAAHGGPAPREPAGAAADAETESRFRAALAAAWPRLSGRQRLAIAWKHRDGLSQRRIAELLGVGEARVSQLLSEGVERLAAGLRAGIERETGSGGADLSRRLAAVIASHLLCVEVAPPPAAEGRSR